MEITRVTHGVLTIPDGRIRGPGQRNEGADKLARSGDFLRLCAPVSSGRVGEEGVEDLPGYAVGVELQLVSLVSGGAVLHEQIGHSNAVDGNVVQTSLCKRFKYSGTETTGEDVFFNRYDATGTPCRLDEKFGIERLHEDGVVDPA